MMDREDSPPLETPSKRKRKERPSSKTRNIRVKYEKIIGHEFACTSISEENPRYPKKISNLEWFMRCGGSYGNTIASGRAAGEDPLNDFRLRSEIENLGGKKTKEDRSYMLRVIEGFMLRIYPSHPFSMTIRR